MPPLLCCWLILRILYLKCCIVFVARGTDWVQLAVLCKHEPLTAVIALLLDVGDVTELNALSWGIRKMVLVVNDEKHLQIFSLFLSFHLKWKFITSSMWCSMLCPSICCGKEVGWQFTLRILNWSHTMNKLCSMVTTDPILTLFFFVIFLFDVT